MKTDARLRRRWNDDEDATASVFGRRAHTLCLWVAPRACQENKMRAAQLQELFLKKTIRFEVLAGLGRDPRCKATKSRRCASATGM